MKSYIPFFLSLFSLSVFGQSTTPAVPYSGKVAMDGINYHGHAQFTFSLGESNGTVHWRNGVDANASVPVFVRNGRYSVLLGGQGMTPLPPKLNSIRTNFTSGFIWIPTTAPDCVTSVPTS